MREQILNAMEEIVAKSGLKNFTMSQIATTLHISKKTIYKYFKNKDELIKDYVGEIFESNSFELDKIMNSDSDDFGKIYAILKITHKYRLPVSSLNEIKVSYPDLWNDFISLKEKNISCIFELLEHAKKIGKLKEYTNLRVLAKLLIKVGILVTDPKFLNDNEISLKDALNAIIKGILYGIVNDNRNEQLGE